MFLRIIITTTVIVIIFVVPVGPIFKIVKETVVVKPAAIGSQPPDHALPLAAII